MGADFKMDFGRLLDKHLENNLSPQEEEELSRTLSDSNNRDSILKFLNSQIRDLEVSPNQADNQDYDSIFRMVKLKIEKKKSLESENLIANKRRLVRRILIQVSSFAAIILVVFFMSGLFFAREKKNNLADTVKSGILNSISTPYGSISKLLLADGTEIIVNAGSSINYNSGYNINNRNITLEGEAYFRVNSETELPFMVSVGDLSIKSIGTTFNIKAYPDDGVIETTLIEGVIEIVKKGIGNTEVKFELMPNQKAIFLKKTDAVSVGDIIGNDPAAYFPSSETDKSIIVSKSIDIDQITAWTNNELVIKSEKLETLVIKLQRKYDVEFIFDDDKIKNYHFTGLLRNEPIEQVLNAICLSAPINFKVDGKSVLLTSKY